MLLLQIVSLHNVLSGFWNYSIDVMKTVLGLLYVVSCVSLQKLQQRRRQQRRRRQQQQQQPQRRQLQLQLLSCVSSQCNAV